MSAQYRIEQTRLTMTTAQTTATPNPTLDAAIAAYPRERIPSDGHTTCLWHRQHEHYVASVVPLLPRCPVCGGIGDPRQPRHELCRARAEHGQPTPRIDTVSACPCAQCMEVRP